MTIVLLVAIGWLQAQAYRPVSLDDLVDAVGSNRDGLEDVDLAPFVADHAIFGGEAIGFAARVRDDPSGPVFVAWRRTGELWRHRWLDDALLEGVRVPGQQEIRLGRVEGLRELGARVVLETRATPAAGAMLSTVVMAGDLSPVAHVAGTPKLALPSGALVLQVDGITAGHRTVELALLDPDARRVVNIYAARAPGRHATVSALRFDPVRSVLTFAATLRGEAAGVSDSTTHVTCTSIGTPAARCK